MQWCKQRPQNPFDTRADKAPSNFDIKNVLAFSLFQDLHADRAPFLRMLTKKLTAGWQLLGIGTFTSGLPFTIYSGEQQTGVGARGADRPDEIGKPDLSTSRTVREDYFGMGAEQYEILRDSYRFLRDARQKHLPWPRPA